ncbi:MAG: biopolymer transporter ExbD [Deltaproteobacteria bacterium]|nr:biopolymer transporter ExbD [Deltaproteobacteria bacterium]
MAINKIRKGRPGIDMTPMVDMGFLLVAFFMIITQFAPPDPVQITVPASTAMAKLPEANLITIMVSKEGIIYIKIDGKRNLKGLGQVINNGWDLGLTADEIDVFSNLPGIGIPVSGLKEYLRLSDSERKGIIMTGIPAGKDHNELGDWISYAMLSNPMASVVIKGDRLTPYPVIKRIMDTLQDIEVNTFSLITDTKSKTD